MCVSTCVHLTTCQTSMNLSGHYNYAANFHILHQPLKGICCSEKGWQVSWVFLWENVWFCCLLDVSNMFLSMHEMFQACIKVSVVVIIVVSNKKFFWLCKLPTSLLSIANSRPFNYRRLLYFAFKSLQKTLTYILVWTMINTECLRTMLRKSLCATRFLSQNCAVFHTCTIFFRPFTKQTLSVYIE